MERELERRISKLGVTHILGVDESGTGAIAGPFYLSGVLGPKEWRKEGVRDSKKTSAEHRKKMIALIEDDIEILHAEVGAFPGAIAKLTHWGAYVRAFKECLRMVASLSSTKKSDIVVIMDGAWKSDLQEAANSLGFFNILFEVKGDRTVPHIGAASIFAKFNRDVEMNLLDKKFPKYYFKDHAGYPTIAHRSSIAEHGFIPGVHRILNPKKKK